MRRMWRNIVFILTLKCEESTRLVSESLDRELSWVERWAVRGHALSCKACRAYARQVRKLREVLRGGRERGMRMAGEDAGERWKRVKERMEGEV